jgi:hypothetical protein
MRGWPGLAWLRPGGFYACASATLLLMDSPTDPAPFRSLTWTGWTMCYSGQLPELGTRCYLRVRVSLDLGDDRVEEVWAAYDPVGWLLKSSARIGADRALAWRLAE